MKKKLYIVRHGKSDWDHDQDDIDRPLKNRGCKDAYKMSELLYARNEVPEKIISSTAARASHTAIIFARMLKFGFSNLFLEDNLYLCSANYIDMLVHQESDEFKSLMIFGHNPGVTDFVNNYYSVYIDNIPTCGVVSLVFEVDKWKDISRKNCIIGGFEYPKMY